MSGRIHATNEMIRNISVQNNNRLSHNKTTTLVLEFGNLTNQILWTNARILGLNVSDPLKVAHQQGWELKDNITPSFKECVFALLMAVFTCQWYVPNTSLTAFET
jgi:hypothetical protein